MKKTWKDFVSINANIEGARSAFEDVCESIYRIYYDPIETIKIEVSQGDDGIDILVGDTTKEIIVIQCKFFLNEIANSQRQQIKDSFKRIIENKDYTLKNWILAIPYGMNILEKKWWDKWKNEQTVKHSLNKDFFKLHNGSFLIDLLKKYDLYNDVFDISDSLILNEISNSINKLINNQQDKDLIDILENSKQKINKIVLDNKRFVKHESYENALYYLDRNNSTVLSGPPGIGKTVTAGAICLEYIKDGYNFLYASGSIKNLTDLYSSDTKQILFFDDFLGSITLNTQLSYSELEKINDFIEINKSNPNIKIIFTTREYILNKATKEHEIFTKSMNSLIKCTIPFDNYIYNEKAKILFNHMAKANFPINYIKKVFSADDFNTIILHDNFSPRIVEWMTSSFLISEDHLEQDFYNVFVYNLNNPRKIWDKVFDNICHSSKKILLMLVFYRSQPSKNRMIKDYLKLENNNDDLLTISNFNIGLNELSDSMIDILNYKDGTFIDFTNPSVLDYLIDYFNSNNILLTKYLDYFNNIITTFRFIILSLDKNEDKTTLKYSGLYSYFTENKTTYYNNILNRLIDDISHDDIVDYSSIKNLIIVTRSYFNFGIDTDKLVHFCTLYLGNGFIHERNGILRILEFFKDEEYDYSHVIKNSIDILKETFLSFNSFTDLDYLRTFQKLTQEIFSFMDSEIIENYHMNEENMIQDALETDSLDKIDDYYNIVSRFSKSYNLDKSHTLTELDNWYDELNDLANNEDLILDEEANIYYYDEDEFDPNYTEKLYKKLITK